MIELVEGLNGKKKEVVRMGHRLADERLTPVSLVSSGLGSSYHSWVVLLRVFRDTLYFIVTTCCVCSRALRLYIARGARRFARLTRLYGLWELWIC